MTEEKSVLDAAVEVMIDIHKRLEEATAAIWAVAIELDKINMKLEALTGENGALKVNIDYEKLGDQISSALGMSLVEASAPTTTEFPPQKKQKDGAK